MSRFSLGYFPRSICANSRRGYGLPKLTPLVPRHRRDIDRTQPAAGAFDVERHRPAFVKHADFGRHIGAVDEHVATAVVTGKEPIPLGLIEKLDLARRAHVFTCADLRALRTGTERKAAGVWRRRRLHVCEVLLKVRRAQFAKARPRARKCAQNRRRSTAKPALGHRKRYYEIEYAAEKIFYAHRPIRMEFGFQGAALADDSQHQRKFAAISRMRLAL